jgi:hypothetical protein
MRLPSVFACLVLALTGLAAADAAAPPPVEMPAAVQQLLQTHAAGVEKAQTAYVKEVERLDESLLAALRREKSKAMKAENLDLALAIDARIKEVEKAKPATDILGKPIAVKRASISERLCAQPWIGTVALLQMRFVFVFKPDGTWNVTNHQGMRGTWRIDEEAKTIRVVSADGTQDRIQYEELSDNWIFDKTGVGQFPFAPQREKEKEKE